MRKSLSYQLAVITIVLLGLMSLAGCGPTPTAAPASAAEVPAPTSPPPAAEEPIKSMAYPDYYPKEYEQIVEASKDEGTLLVYSVMAESNWKPVIEAFNELYPWIEVQTLDLGGSEVFERYYAETISGAQTADLSITADRLKNAEELDAILQDFYAGRTLAENMEFIMENNLTAGPVYDIDQILEDPYVQARQVVVELPDPEGEMEGVPMHNVVPLLSATPGAIRRPAPKLGEHNAEIFGELGLSDADLGQLVAEGVI